MEKTKDYPKTKFSTVVIREAHNAYLESIPSDIEPGKPNVMTVSIGRETWQHDTLEEFLADYKSADRFSLYHIVGTNRLIVTFSYIQETTVIVSLPTRALIQGIFQIFDEHEIESAIEKPVPHPPRVFIGHGRNEQWRDLKDHLQDKHGIEVVAYEVGPRGGLSVKQVLEEMLHQSSIAFLVMTGEDEDAEGRLHARENVIHEAGLFQGYLGFDRAIVLLEEGVNEFSNIEGINQIRFGKGRIQETFGEVVATIGRLS